MLICSRCKKEKSESDFYKEKNKRGYQQFCKKCSRANSSRWSRLNREYCNEKARKYRGGYAGNLSVISADNDAKQEVRRLIAEGAQISSLLGKLIHGRTHLAICEIILKSGDTASLDGILHYVYGDEPSAEDRRRQYNALKRAIFTIRKRLSHSGISLINCGYGKGYSLVIDAGISREVA